MTTLETLEKIANSVKANVHNKTSLEDRKNMLLSALKAEGFKAYDAGERRAGGAFRVCEMKDCYRVFYRCGYGKYNYAPCVEVSK